MNVSPGRLLVLLSSFLFITPLLGLQTRKESPAFASPPVGMTAIAQSLSPVPANQRQKIAEQFLDLVFSKQYEKATEYISPAVKSEFPAAVIQQKVIAFQKQNGAFIKRLNSELDGDVVVVNLLFKNNPQSIILSFDDNLKIVNADYFIERTASSPK